MAAVQASDLEAAAPVLERRATEFGTSADAWNEIVLRLRAVPDEVGHAWQSPSAARFADDIRTYFGSLGPLIDGLARARTAYLMLAHEARTYGALLRSNADARRAVPASGESDEIMSGALRRLDGDRERLEYEWRNAEQRFHRDIADAVQLLHAAARREFPQQRYGTFQATVWQKTVMPTGRFAHDAQPIPKTVAEWQARAYLGAGIDPTKWDPEKGLAANAEYVRAVYERYGEYYQERPELQWAAFAKLAGTTLYAGWQDLYLVRTKGMSLTELATGFSIPGIDLDAVLTATELEWFEHKFLHMEREIFDDLAWQHEAYREGGVAAIKDAFRASGIKPNYLGAWDDIASGDPNRVAAGTRALALHEQYDVIQHDYDDIRSRHGPVGIAFTHLLTFIANNPLPGGRPYRDVVTYVKPSDIPDPSIDSGGPISGGIGPWGLHVDIGPFRIGNPIDSVIDEVSELPSIPRWNIAKFPDRWEWVTKGMLPKLRDMTDDPDRFRALIETPLLDRAAEQRMVPGDAP